MVRWVDLTSLPKKMWAGKECVDWLRSAGCKCKFKYADIEGEVEIVEYNKKNKKLTIKYLNYDLFEIQYAHFQKCQFGKLLKKVTGEFRVEVGQVFKDNKRDLIIIDREYRKTKSNQKQKWYKYHCNKCGNKDWIIEDKLLKNIGCNVCCTPARKTVLGINTVWDKARWMCDLGVSEEDAKKYTYGSHQEIIVKCPDCKREKKMLITDIYNRKSISCSCGDGFSFPEKFVMSLLEQLSINYVKEYSPKWIEKKRYDFYFELSNKKYIIETHGEQHYNGSFYTVGGKTLEEDQENDKLKKELALKNGIDYYIELDCRESNLEWIRNSVINSELNKILELESVNWRECESYATSNKIKEMCDYIKASDKKVSTKELEKKFIISRRTVNRYLERGRVLGYL